MVTLRQFKDLADVGWPKIGGTKSEIPNQVWIDSGYMAQVVYAFCREARQRYRPAIGRGAGQQRMQWYNRPTSTGSVVRQIGEGFHLNLLPSERLMLVEVNADYWKTLEGRCGPLHQEPPHATDRRFSPDGGDEGSGSDDSLASNTPASTSAFCQQLKRRHAMMHVPRC